MIRIAVIGCGSVVQQYHLPAIAALPAFRLEGLADTDKNRLECMRGRWRVLFTTTDYRDLSHVDAVLIATPHALHAPMCEFFLSRGVHVLVEKPMAFRSEDAERLVALARDRRAVFAVGVFRRYYPVSTFMRSALKEGEMSGLGALCAIDAEEGSVYDWELQSHFLLDRALAGGGVTIDTGSHLLDRLLWWLPEFEPRVESYRDDSSSGVEADSELLFSLARGERSIGCAVRMSRIRALRNTIRLTFERGIIEIESNSPHALSLRVEGWPRDLRAGVAESISSAPVEFFSRQLEDFARAIEGGQQPINSAETNVPTIRLIEQAYAVREPLVHAWEAFS